MRFTVTWIPSAEGRLAKIWLEASDRGAIAKAANQIDRELRRNADTAGEGRFETERILFVPPLAIIYDVSVEDRLATVFAAFLAHEEGGL